MRLADKTVLVIGGGAAGMAAALDLADLEVSVELVEQAPFLGGNAAGYACKATDRCVKCGACMVEERLERVFAHPRIRVSTAAHVTRVARKGRFEVQLAREPQCIDPERCTACGDCLEACPAPGALERSVSGHGNPPVALRREHCLYTRDGSCARCREVCREGAVDLEKVAFQELCMADAVIMATGFAPFDPTNKPYGYRRFADVITNLQLEQMLRASHQVTRPSDGRPPERMAFIQCVGSRDATLNHLWCSKVCCASALRMARVIQARRPETQVTFFYIDVQTFGRDFETQYAELKNSIQMKRAIPADILETGDGHLEVISLDSASGESVEELFDMVVLSVGMTPRAGVADLAAAFGMPLTDSGFAARTDAAGPAEGVFTAGSACGPMSIAESIADGGRAAWMAVDYLHTRNTEVS